MKLRFNKRKWWHLKNNKCITLEVSGFTSHPSLYIRLDGCEREVTLHIGFGFGLWISFERMFPKWLFAKRWSKYTNSYLSADKEYSIAFHNGSFWYNFGLDPDEWNSGESKWRRGCFHIVDAIKGKHKYEKIEIDRRQILLPFFEGVYNVEVIRNKRIDSYKHWLTRRMESWEVRCGYYDEKAEWIDLGIPHEGKGENSWDCDEDATFAMSFPGKPYNQLNTPYEASLYFWNSMMKSRERYGHEKWLPERFKNKKLEIIRKPQTV